MAEASEYRDSVVLAEFERVKALSKVQAGQYAFVKIWFLNRYKDELTPAIILIPGKEGSLGIGAANIKKAVERAVGADIL